MICLLLVCYPDDLIKMAFQKTKNINNCIILVLYYITQNCNIIKMMKINLKIILKNNMCSKNNII